MLRIASLAALAVTGMAFGEITLCDIPSGSGSNIDWTSGAGLEGIPFTIESSGMTFRNSGHATTGVVRAWDSERNSPTTGLVTFTAAEGWELNRLHFDVSGFKEYQRQANIKIYLDGSLFWDYTWNFNGNSTLIHWGMDFDTPVNSIAISMDYFDGVQFAAGLDNIEVGSFNIVPAPGAIALLGVAGVVGTRRRRRG